MAIYSYDDVLEIYAYQENHLRIVATQGEGTDKTVAQLTANDLLKAPRFQLCDERGIISIPTSGNPRVELAVKKQNGAEDLLDCVISDAANGIVVCPIRKSLTDVPGDVEGEIRLITANAVLKFTGVNFYIYDGVSDSAAMQSSQFSDLILALQQVSAIITGGSSGTVALDTVIQHGGTNPVASGVIYDYVHGNYRQISYAHVTNADSYSDGGVYIDDATDVTKMYYLRNSGNAIVGIILPVFPPGYAYGMQIRINYSAQISCRVKTQDSDLNYTWKEWTPIGTTSNIQDAAITAVKIANNAVTTDKIQDSAVTTNKIANSAVVEGKIADGSVTTAKINNAAVTEQKIADSAVTTSKISTKAVTSVKIDDGAITTDKIATLAVTAEKIRNFAITQDKLAIHAVDTENLAIGAVITDRIADDAIVNSKIKDNAVTSGKIANNAVITEKIATSAVTPNKLDRTYKESLSISASEIDDAVQENIIYHTIVEGEVASVRCVYNGLALRAQYAETVSGKLKYRTQAKAAGEWQVWSDWHLYASTQNIENGAITADKIGTNAVTSAKINNGAVSTDKIANYAVTADKLANNSVTESKIQDSAITTGKISTGAVTTGKIADSAVTTAKLADSSITTNKIANGAIITDKLSNDAITNDKIADSAVDTDQIANYSITQDKLDSNAVGTEEMIDYSVTSAKLANSSVVTSKIANGAVTAEKLAETYVQTIRTIAGIDLEDNITASELAHALTNALVNNEGILNRAQSIHLSKSNAPASGGSTQLYFVNDIYINVLTGDLWFCQSATFNSVWYYTWDYRGALYNYPLMITCEIDSDNWNNNEYDLTSELRSAANGRNMVDIDFDNTVYNQLVVDGCYGLYVVTDTSTSRPTFTLHAMNNAPTVDITIQLILSQVVISQ